MDDESSRYDKLVSMLQDGSPEPRNLPLEYLRNITDNFSDDRLLGEGGFGTVYKGVLKNGETIAVKKLNSSMPGVKDKHFENEAYHLMRLKHPNVVLLIGWCSETENIYVQHNGKYICAEKSERLLCLEYMPKGCLRGYLSDEASGLCWDTRYKIIEGICYGLHYLHEEWQPNAPIIHMDLKPANILLDSNMMPKIADFGLSRLFSEEKTWTCTTSRDGTLGYMAPEYINRGLITTKSDIFSLGVIIIEIVSGRRDYPDEETGISSQEFIELVTKNWRNRLKKTLDYTYTTLEIYYQQIRRCIQIGLVCLKFDRSKRPTTSQIINMLHGSENENFSGRKEVLKSWRNRFKELNHTSIEKDCEQIKRCIEMGLSCVETDASKRPTTREIIESLEGCGSSILHVSNEKRSAIDKLDDDFWKESYPTFNHRKVVQVSNILETLGVTEEGKPSPRDRLGVEILEQPERRDLILGEAFVAVEGDILRGRLIYLENRVALARILFPMEIKKAMEIAQVDESLEFTIGSRTDRPEIQQTTADLNGTPFKMNEGHLARMRTLSKTVELGKRFFPSCSKVLDRMMDDDTEMASLGRDTSTEKKRRFHKLQDVLRKAFSEDKEEFDKQAHSFSTLSMTIGAI